MNTYAPTKCQRSGGYITATCELAHKVVYQLKCRKCEGCMKDYRDKFIAQCFEKYSMNPSKYYVFWTIGSNLSESPENILKLKDAWKKFRKVMFNYNWSPLVYVIEAGSSGGKLHIHFIVEAGIILDHQLVKQKWQNAIGLKHAHTNYSFPRICKYCKHWNKKDSVYPCKNCGIVMKPGTFTRPNGKKTIIYLSKYTSKGLEKRRYYWLGNWYKTKLEKKSAGCLAYQKMEWTTARLKMKRKNGSTYYKKVPVLGVVTCNRPYLFVMSKSKWSENSLLPSTSYLPPTGERGGAQKRIRISENPKVPVVP